MTRNNMNIKLLKEINENWFKNHNATIENYGDIKVINFRGKDICYYMQIILCDYKVIITGDIGEAIFLLTETADIHKIAKYDLRYLLEKLRCFNGDKYNFDLKIAKRDLKESCVEAMRDDYCSRKDIHKQYIKLKENLEQCDNIFQWQSYLYESSDLDFDNCGYFSDIGQVLDFRLIGYHEAFKIISKLLKDNN